MALTRPMLKGMGLSEEQVQAIIDAHTESTDALKQQRDKYKEDAEKLPALQSELDALKNGEDWQAKYTAKEQELADYKAEVARRETLAAKQTALRKLAKDAELSEAGIEKAVKYTDYGTFELDANGAVKDAKALMDAIKAEWSGYVKTAEDKGASVETPPAKDKNVFDSMSLADKMKYANENPNAPEVRAWLTN